MVWHVTWLHLYRNPFKQRTAGNRGWGRSCKKVREEIAETLKYLIIWKQLPNSVKMYIFPLDTESSYIRKETRQDTRHKLEVTYVKKQKNSQWLNQCTDVHSSSDWRTTWMYYNADFILGRRDYIDGPRLLWLNIVNSVPAVLAFLSIMNLQSRYIRNRYICARTFLSVMRSEYLWSCVECCDYSSKVF